MQMLKTSSRLLHFCILMQPTSLFQLIFIFWLIYLSFSHISTYVDSFQTIPNQLRITQNQLETIIDQPHIMLNQFDHLAICQTSSINHLIILFQALSHLSTFYHYIKTIKFGLWRCYVFRYQVNLSFQNLIVDIVESLNV